MGEIYVKKNNAFERVVSDGNTVIITGGGGGGGSGVTIAFHADSSDLYDACFTSNTPGEFNANGLFGYAKGVDRRMINMTVRANSSSLGTEPFNTEQGYFTAPVDGLYQFHVSATARHLDQVHQTSPRTEGTVFLWIEKGPQANPPVTPNINNRYGNYAQTYLAEHTNNQDQYYIPISGSWVVPLVAGEKVALFTRVLSKDAGNPCEEVIITEISFSGCYVGGASVTPANPVAVYAHTGANLYPNNASALRIRNSVLSSANPNPSFLELIDPSFAFDPITGIFTAPVTGIYKIGFSAIEQDREQGYNYYWIVKTASGTTIGDTFNGSVESSAPYAPLNYYGTYVRESYYTTEENPTGGSWIVQLNVGDKITWHCSRYVTAEDGSGDNSIYNIALSAHLLTSTQTIGVSTDVSFFARNEAASEGALPDLAQNTPYYLSKQQLSGSLSQTIVVQDNVNSCYSQTTGEFTAPISGMYEFEGRLSGYHNLSDSRSDAFVWFEKNAPTTPAAGADPYSRTNRVSSVSRDGGSFAVATRFGASIKEHLSLVAGDRIVLCGMSGGYGINHDWSFSGKLLRRS